jgi:hypothetical protein
MVLELLSALEPLHGDAIAARLEQVSGSHATLDALEFSRVRLRRQSFANTSHPQHK